ncbi:MAG: DUF4352 domain-containing protein [Clostridiales bacterium]|nr:DUF4352 domain-containing protein [Clostridiales bacterium]
MKRISVLMLACLLLFAGCSSNPEEAETTTRVPEANTQAVVEVPDYGVGDLQILGELSFTVDSFEQQIRIPRDQSMIFEPQDKENNIFLSITLTIQNNSLEPQRLFPQSYSTSSDIVPPVLFGEGTEEASEFPALLLELLEDDLHESTLEAGESITGILVFEVPKELVQDEETDTLLKLSLGEDSIVFLLEEPEEEETTTGDSDGGEETTAGDSDGETQENTED